MFSCLQSRKNCFVSMMILFIAARQDRDWQLLTGENSYWNQIHKCIHTITIINKQMQTNKNTITITNKQIQTNIAYMHPNTCFNTHTPIVIHKLYCRFKQNYLGYDNFVSSSNSYTLSGTHCSYFVLIATSKFWNVFFLKKIRKEP